MELGEKIKKARLDAGLSQRQLCGEEITRNMLSLIENGSAKPSMRTLQYLAGRLGRNVSYFLEDSAIVSPNTQTMALARQLFDQGDFSGVVQALEGYKSPDEGYDREQSLLRILSYLALAEAAADAGREPYARELLEKASGDPAYCAREVSRRRLLLMGQLRMEKVEEKLPSLDRELMLRAREALEQGELNRAVHLLEAMEQRDNPQWYFLRGECSFREKAYDEAARFFHGAEAAWPREVAPKLEQCYRELQDYRRAYEYACMQKR